MGRRAGDHDSRRQARQEVRLRQEDQPPDRRNRDGGTVRVLLGVQEVGEKPVREPAQGALLAVPESERWSNNGLGYTFEVEAGRYEVVLLFAEIDTTFSGKGKRLFDIEINAKKVDVFTEAGGASKPWQFRKVVDVTGKELEIK
ncbi:MAG: hypothetical protein FJ304_10095 [Planctomycetes bacterium]|nr:hypothetical protein [Planctomycetota bacterium]